MRKSSMAGDENKEEIETVKKRHDRICIYSGWSVVQDEDDKKYGRGYVGLHIELPCLNLMGMLLLAFQNSLGGKLSGFAYHNG